MKKSNKQKTIISIGIIFAALGLSYLPLPGIKTTVVIVSGTELEEPLKELATKFEQVNPNIDLELKFQGSQDIVNRYIDQKNDFIPTVLIPANGELLEELTRNNKEPFYDTPQAIAKTMLVGIAWQERGKILFPDGRFQWKKIEQALAKRNWKAIGGQANWGSFDLVITDPIRSNSGQLTLSLWTQAKINHNSLKSEDFNNPEVQSFFALIKRSVYQPPRSTDVLLQEFITRGANDGDVATVYESTALSRWSQAKTSQGQPYQIYYPNPTIETTVTAAIVRQDVDKNTANAAKKFVLFLTQNPQQEVFVKYGFRPAIDNLNLESVSQSPWKQNIPGVMVNPSVQVEQPPSLEAIEEIQRLWSRVN
jgi:ABC-type molybdate transport system substrate-binding protein